eukprot:14245-Heterococcus_DN1.PRE.2
MQVHALCLVIIVRSVNKSHFDIDYSSVVDNRVCESRSTQACYVWSTDLVGQHVPYAITREYQYAVKSRLQLTLHHVRLMRHTYTVSYCVP